MSLAIISLYIDLFVNHNFRAKMAEDHSDQAKLELASVDSHERSMEDENTQLKKDLAAVALVAAAAQAELKRLRAEREKERAGKEQKRENRITDISTFHSTDKIDLDKKNILHYLVASRHFYKMGGSGLLWDWYYGPWDYDPDLTITYIENCHLKRNFEKAKKEFEDNGTSYKEIFLFHATDEENIDNIFNDNFDIDHHPLSRAKVYYLSLIDTLVIIAFLKFFRRWLMGAVFT